MKKVVKFVVSNIVLGINYSCPVFCLLYFLFLIMYNHLLLPVLINLYQEIGTRKVNANQPYKHNLVVWLKLLYFLGYLVPNFYLCSVCSDGFYFIFLLIFFSHFLVFGRIEDTDDPKTNLLVNRIHFALLSMSASVTQHLHAPVVCHSSLSHSVCDSSSCKQCLWKVSMLFLFFWSHYWCICLFVFLWIYFDWMIFLCLM